MVTLVHTYIAKENLARLSISHSHLQLFIDLLRKPNEPNHFHLFDFDFGGLPLHKSLETLPDFDDAIPAASFYFDSQRIDNRFRMYWDREGELAAHSSQATYTSMADVLSRIADQVKETPMVETFTCDQVPAGERERGIPVASYEVVVLPIGTTRQLTVELESKASTVIITGTKRGLTDLILCLTALANGSFPHFEFVSENWKWNDYDLRIQATIPNSKVLDGMMLHCNHSVSVEAVVVRFGRGGRITKFGYYDGADISVSRGGLAILDKTICRALSDEKVGELELTNYLPFSDTLETRSDKRMNQFASKLVVKRED